MQLIALFLFLLSATALVATILFVSWWHRTYRKTSLVQTLHEDICHIGVSAVVIYPETVAPLVALLEEEYPRSEAVVVADLKANSTPLGELVGLYHLVKVNHSHLACARSLYRSRHRAYRRVVVVDLPLAYSGQAMDVARAVASFDNILYLSGESIVEPNALAYCANIVATQSSADVLLIRSIVGADARFESGDVASGASVVRLRADTPLAWRKSSMFGVALAMGIPSAMFLLAHLSQGWLMSIATMLVALVVGLLFSVAWSVKSKKSLFVRLNSVVQNCYKGVVSATLRESKIRDTPLCHSRVQERSRPERYHEDAPPMR